MMQVLVNNVMRYDYPLFIKKWLLNQSSFLKQVGMRVGQDHHFVVFQKEKTGHKEANLKILLKITIFKKMMNLK